MTTQKPNIIAELDSAGYRAYVPNWYTGPAYLAAPAGKVRHVRRAVKAADQGGTVQDPGDGSGARNWIAHAIDHGGIITDERGVEL